MPITIQELLASDTLSQAVDKINFNFDQLLLNGGGPVGPIGPAGPSGPIGGRGIKGTTWYSGVNDPNTLIIPNIIEGDYFLQSNGDVWEYNGTVWIQSSVNLTGPTGAAGSSVGFDYIGGYNGANPPASLNNENVAFPVPMPGGIPGGANQLTNQGVSTMLFGAVGSTVNPPAGISYTSAFQIPNAMAVQLDASLVSVLIHQKDSSSSAIRFMGGGEILSDKYEQTSLSNLSNIYLGTDDSLSINIPKAATAPVGLSDLIGLNLNTIRRGQQFFSGKQINLISGTDSTPSGLPGEISDITLTINTSNPSIPAKLSVATTLSSATALFELGGNIIIPPSLSTTRTGFGLVEAGEIGLIGGRIRLNSSIAHGLDIMSSSVSLFGRTGPVNISTLSGQNIQLSSAGSLGISSLLAINIGSTSSINVVSNNIVLQGSNPIHTVRIDSSSLENGSVGLRGNVTWGSSTALSYLPFVTTHRNISIHKSGSFTRSPIYVGRLELSSGGTDRDLLFEGFKGASQASPIEYIRIATASTDIRNTSGNAGFVGHTVENTSTAMSAASVGFRLRGVDRSGGAAGVQTRFHASEDTTAVSNRMQYTRKTLNINPLTAGISGLIGYTIPSSFMDTSFLDIYIGWNGTPFLTVPGAANSSPDFSIFIPDGTYTGQRLNIHLVIAPTTALVDYGSGAVLTSWPPNIFGGKVWLRAITWQGTTTGYGSDNGDYIAELQVGPGGTLPPDGAEGYYELVWIGQTYQAGFQDAGGTVTVRSRQRGWVAVNGVRAQEIGLSGNAGFFRTNAAMRFV